MFVLAWSVLGGAERSALATARYLVDETGAEVEVLALTSTEGHARHMFGELGIIWQSQQTDWHGSRRTKARELVSLTWRLRRMRPDVLLPYTTRPNVLCGLAWRATGASLCVWNQQDLFAPTKFSRALVSKAARKTPLLIANSQAAGDYLVSVVGVPSQRVRVILHGVQGIEPVEDRAAWRALLAIDDGTIAVSMLAHLHNGKDHETLLRAWPIVLRRLTDSGHDAVLLLAGRPSGTEEAVKALAFDLELGRTVRFLGDVSDVGGLLAATDIAVLSSPSESAPHALLESMSAGLPVAGSDIAGIREIVGSAQHPYLAPPGDAELLAEAIARLGEDAELRKRLGDENRRHVLARAPIPAPEATAAAIAASLAERRRT